MITVSEYIGSFIWEYSLCEKIDLLVQAKISISVFIAFDLNDGSVLKISSQKYPPDISSLLK